MVGGPLQLAEEDVPKLNDQIVGISWLAKDGCRGKFLRHGFERFNCEDWRKAPRRHSNLVQPTFATPRTPCDTVRLRQNVLAQSSVIEPARLANYFQWFGGTANF